MTMDISERSERSLMAIAQPKKKTGFPLNFLGYNAKGQKGLEGAAKRRLKHPGSRYLKIKHLRSFRRYFFDSWEL